MSVKTNYQSGYRFEQLQQQLTGLYSQEQNGEREEFAWKQIIMNLQASDQSYVELQFFLFSEENYFLDVYSQSLISVIYIYRYIYSLIQPCVQ